MNDISVILSVVASCIEALQARLRPVGAADRPAWERPRFHGPRGGPQPVIPPIQVQKDRSGAVVVLGLVALVLLPALWVFRGTIGLAYQRQVERSWQETVDRLAPLGRVSERGEGPLQGKVLPIRIDGRYSQRLNKMLDDPPYLDGEVFLALPSELRAAEGDDVGAVLFMRYNLGLEGRYVDTETGEEASGAWREWCRVTVVDVASEQVLHAGLLRGEEPPKVQEGVYAVEKVGRILPAQVIRLVQSLKAR